MSLRRILPCLLALALLGGAGAAQAAEVLNLRIGWITVPTSLAPILFTKPALARHLGRSYSVSPIHFAGSSQMVTALASGDLDIAELSFSSFGYAIQNGHMADLRVIADELEDGVTGHNSTEFMVLRDGPIHRIEDLKGRVLATNVIGAGVDIGLRTMLRRHGLEDKRDYTIIESDFVHMSALLAARKADLVTSVPPFALDPAFRGIAAPLFAMKDAFGTTQLLSLAARREFLAKNRAAVIDYLEDELRELRWYLDPKNHDEAVATVAQFAKQPTSHYDWVFTEKDFYRASDGRPNLDAMQRNLAMQKEFGFLKEDIEVAKYADLTLVTEAAKRLP
jgi:sulfonate transport system substrate-binding protein